jgi:glutamine synthetase
MRWRPPTSTASSSSWSKSVAEKHGFRATFMPKPVEGLTGNGCHTHVSVWDAPGDAAKTNVFAIDPTPGSATSELGPIGTGPRLPRRDHETRVCHGGDHQPHGEQLQALNAPVTLSGATWAPNTVTWTGNNRTHMVRVPGPGRFELRLPDGAANPYLLQAVIIAAGLDGMATDADPASATTSTCMPRATRCAAR